MEQMTINFEAGLRTRYPTIYHVLRAMAERSAKPLKAIAADLDMSSSELSRRLNADLNENDTRVFDIRFLDGFTRATCSTLVIEWLIEGHMVAPEKAQQRAVRELARMLPQISALLDAVNKDGGQS
jgi:AraC-like DNA-binding protein